MEEDKDKIIALQRKKIEELSKKNNALEQENALLKHEEDRKNEVKKTTLSLNYLWEMKSNSHKAHIHKR